MLISRETHIFCDFPWRTSTQCLCISDPSMMKPYGLVLITNVIREGSGEPALLCNLFRVSVLTNLVFKWMKTKAQTI